MLPLPDSAKTMGASVPTFLVLAAICWLCMLGTMATWIGRASVAGRDTDRVVSQAYSGGFALLLWIFLAALLLIASSKEVMPVEAGALAWFVHPLSCAAALGAIAVLFDPTRRWLAAIPALIPLLIAGYVLYGFYPSWQTVPMKTAGVAMWAAVAILSVTVLPATSVFFASSHGGAIEAKPGPEMDRFVAKQRQEYRDEVLDKLRQMDDETKLYEPANMVHPDNPALAEVLAFMRTMPNRQADAIQMLESPGSTVLPFLADIDLKPTPELCTAARAYLHNAVQQRLSSPMQEPNSFVGMEFSQGIPGIRWIARNCGCNAQLDEMEAYARKQQQDAPEVKEFLAALAGIRAEKK